MKRIHNLGVDPSSSFDVTDSIELLQSQLDNPNANINRLYFDSQISILKSIEKLPETTSQENLLKLLSLRIGLHRNNIQDALIHLELQNEEFPELDKKYFVDGRRNIEILDDIKNELDSIIERNTKKIFNLELTEEKLLNSKGEVFMTNYLGLVIEGEEIRPQTLNYRIRLTDEEFPIILKGSKFVSISERTEEDNYYVPSTNPEILKFLIND